MTSTRHLALMALVRDIEEPTKTYRRSVRQASAAFTDSPEWDRAVGRGNAALDTIEAAVRAWVAKNPAPFTVEELAAAQADVDHLNAEFPDEPEHSIGGPRADDGLPKHEIWSAHCEDGCCR
jgi:hypothetical protein